MELLKSLLGMSMLVGLACCGDGDESISDGEKRTDAFVIVNKSGHFVRIDDTPFESSKEVVSYTIQDNDSIRFERISYMHSVRPFVGNVFLSFDDSLKYKCELGVGIVQRSPADVCFYTTNKVSDDYFVSRYVITEEDYEYAKAHPYKEE